MKLPGNLDFKTELTPLTKRQVDVFVRCHRQGDPSCTYLDVLGWGVPFVGYDNEAFRGVVRHSHTGWMVPMNQPERLAGQIAVLNTNRAAAVSAAYQALDLARQHTFERTFLARIEHLRACANRDTSSPRNEHSRKSEL
jgi:hypothetical protein